MEATTSVLSSFQIKLTESTRMMPSSTTSTLRSTTTEAASITESLTKAIESGAESLGNFLKAEADSLIETNPETQVASTAVVDEDWQKTSMIFNF